MPKDISAKRCREEDVKVLLDLVEASKGVLECKKADATTWREKEAEWTLVTRRYNARTLQTRTMKEVKAKFDGLKKLARKRAAAEKQLRRATEGGPCTPTTTTMEDSAVFDRVHQIIQLSADGMPARFDTDLMESVAQKESSADKAEPEELGFIDEIGDGEVVANDLDFELKEPEIIPSKQWGHYTPNMPRALMSAALAPKPAPRTEPKLSTDPESEPEAEQSPELGAKPGLRPHSKLHSRRRPVMRPKKTSSLLSSTNKFVTLAEVKTEFARVQLAATVARNASSERRDEELHALNLQILQQELRMKIVLVEQMELKQKLKRMKEDNE